jgi:hypothetical protein
MYLWSEQAMAQRINYEKHRFDGKRKLAVTDEREFRKNDVASRWIEQAEKWNKVAAKIKQRQRAKKKKSKVPPPF